MKNTTVKILSKETVTRVMDLINADQWIKDVIEEGETANLIINNDFKHYKITIEFNKCAPH